MTIHPTLEIDSIPVSLAEVWVHQQNDPYPGDHTFNLRVPVNCVGEWKGKLASTKSNDDLVNEALKMVKWEIHHWLEQQSKEHQHAKFVLNKVISVVIENDVVTMSGICSTFITQETNEAG